MIGAQLAHFRITAKLGEGGMGAVYRAEDTRLGREVAIKVLPDALVDDPDRLARFEREARVLASLDHPNIAGIHEVGHAVPESDAGPAGQAIHFLVMQLAPGETLEDRMARGPVPVDEAIPLALQIAEALEAAHEKGVVHRDLKPANVKVDAEGHVVVLDFGLAKALEGDVANVSSPGITESPTLTGRATLGGVILGTAAYMAPEQAKGVPVDKRSDIWAFGVVLWEMLMGERLFAGETVSETLAAVLRDPIDLSSLPPTIPPRLRALMARCLERDPKLRLRDVGEARIVLGAPLDAWEAPPEAPSGRPWRERLAWGAAVLGAVAAAALGLRATSGPSPAPVQFAITLGTDQRLSFVDEPILAISRDGRRIAFCALDAESGHDTIHVRELGQLGNRPLHGTEGATGPFFSPDGETLGFFADQALKTIPIGGGSPSVLAPAANARGGVWTDEGDIVYSPDFVGPAYRISARGGVPEVLVEPDPERGERTFRWPDVLPDGTLTFVVGSVDSPNNYDRATLVAYSPKSGRREVLAEGVNYARFLPPATLLYSRAGLLYAAPFDPDGPRLTGLARPVREGVSGDPSSGAGYWAVSRSGTLVLVPGSSSIGRFFLAVVRRDGEAERLPLEPRGFYHPRFSPDGSRLAFGLGEGMTGAGGDIWTYTLATGVLSRLTFEGGLYPTWSTDGSRIAFTRPEAPEGLYVAAADGVGGEERRLEFTSGPLLANSWSPDGTLALTQLGESSVHLLRGSGEPELWEESASMPAFSPDGRWIAYTSPGSGESSIFVRPVEGPGKWQVSPGLGSYPRWSGDGRELFYLAIGTVERSLVAVDVTPGDTFRFGAPRVVLPDLGFRYATSTAPQLNWDVAPDGRSFAFVELDRDETERSRIEVGLHWGDEVRRALAPR